MTDGQTPADGAWKWSLAAEDLSAEGALKGCATEEFEGRPRPTIGKIALLARLGQGGMGLVYFGVNPRLATEVAVKVLPPNFLESKTDAVDRFIREARLAARLRSEHLVAVHDADRDPATGAHFIVMEFVRGMTARDWQRGSDSIGEKVPEAAALDVCIAATKGLAVAHVEGVLHRDLKPENILIPVAADQMLLFDRAKLADLGLARTETGDGVTASQIGMGTPGFMAPEQARDARHAKKQADVFGMGATLYALLAGEPPFKGSSPMDTILRTMKGETPDIASVRPDISGATVAVLARCLAPDPEKRFPDASALLEALQLCRGSLGESWTDDGTVSRIDRLVTREEKGKRILTDPLATPTPPGLLPTAAAQSVRRGRRATPTPPSGARKRTLVVPIALALVAAAALAVWYVLREPAGLWIESRPPGAAVSVDGAKKGVTPLLVQAAGGRHAVRIALDGYRPVELKDVALADGERRDVVTTLERLEPGLVVTSEPPGAEVVVDGRSEGFTPLVVSRLSFGAHEVRVARAYYVPFSRKDAVVSEGARTPIHAVLERGTNALAVRATAGKAALTLEREGDPPKRYAAVLDAAGVLAMKDVEAGEYRVQLARPGFDAFAGKVVVPVEGDAASIVATMREHDGRLSVVTKPPGATVLVDGRNLGAAPLAAVALPAGPHKVELVLADHVGVSKDVRVNGDETADLGTVELVAWTVLDLSQLDADVVAKVQGSVVLSGWKAPPGPVDVVLERPGYAPQTVIVNGRAGEKALVRAEPWDNYLARLDLSELPAGVRVLVDGEEKSERLLAWPGAREVKLVLLRPGFEGVSIAVAVSVGEATPTPTVRWTAVETRLDLAELAPDVQVLVDGKPAADGAVLAPGPHAVAFGAGAKAVAVEVSTQRFVRPRASAGAVAAALEWLARHQGRDGRWPSDRFDENCIGGRCTGRGQAGNDVGVTGLALLAFLSAGDTPGAGPHAEILDRGLAWLRSQQDQDGGFGPRAAKGFQFGNAIATLAVVEAYAHAGDPDVKECAERAVAFVAKSQNPDLGWRYEYPGAGDNDTAVTVWMARAMNAACRAGIYTADRVSLRDACAWIDRVTEPDSGRTGYRVRGGGPQRYPEEAAAYPADRSESCTAGGLLVRLWAGRTPAEDGAIGKGAALLAKKTPKWDVAQGSLDFVYWHFGTLAAARAGGDVWQSWRGDASQALAGHQRQESDGDENGSWDPSDVWGAAGGRVYATAIDCLTMQCLAR